MTEMREPPADQSWLEMEGVRVRNEVDLRHGYPGPATWEDVVEAIEKIRATPAPRTDPIKLTLAQWAGVRSRTPGPAPSPYAAAFGGNLDYLTGVPVVLVDNESDSTPFVEGWLKPKRKSWWRRLGLKWWWQR